MKKFFAVILALAMTFALSAVALAAATQDPQVNAGDKKGTITVSNAEVGTDYKLYRIFDLTMTGSGENINVAYTINSAWSGFFTGSGSSYIVGENSGSLNSITVEGTTKYINITTTNVAQFANDAQAWIISNSPDASYTVTGVDTTTFTVDVAVLGYYLVFPVGASEQTTTNACLCSLTSTVNDASVEIKAKKPTIEKTSTQADADVKIGDEIPFTITGKVPNVTGYTTYNWKVEDTMTGLTFKEDPGITLKIGGTEITLPTASTPVTGITYTHDAGGFELNIEMVAFLEANTSIHAGDAIVITYLGIVNDTAAVNNVGTNTATLTYNNNPGGSGTGTDDSVVKVYTGNVVVTKTKGDGNTPLAGASFTLYKMDGSNKLWYKYTAATTGTNPTPARVTWENSEANASIIAAAGNATNGYKATFTGLPAGTYYVHEAVTPSGYSTAPDKEVTIVRSENDTTHAVTITDGDIKVENNSGTTLPSVGGEGTKFFYIIGGILMVGAAVLLVTRKKMSVTK